MSNEVIIRDFAKDYFPFEFPGYVGAAHCYLRVRIHGSNIFVLCAQLIDYHGTSVTNGLEGILDKLVDTLMREKDSDGNSVIHVVERFPLLRRLVNSDDELAASRHRAARQRFLQRCQWFEYYPPGTGFGESDTVSLVTFSESGSPSWSYASPAYFAEQYPAGSFDIPLDLGAWNKSVI